MPNFHTQTLKWHCPHDGEVFNLLDAQVHMRVAHPGCSSCEIERMVTFVLAHAGVRGHKDGGYEVYLRETPPNVR